MINIRKAITDDIEDFKKVVTLSIVESCKNYYSQQEIDALLQQYPGKALYEKWLQERVLIVATNNDEIIGFAQYNPEMAYIEAVHVLPKYYYNGVGRQLVEQIENIVRNLGANKITLESSLNAVDFYEKCGYTRKNSSKYKCNNGAELEVVQYEKEISS